LPTSLDRAITMAASHDSDVHVRGVNRSNTHDGIDRLKMQFRDSVDEKEPPRPARRSSSFGHSPKTSDTSLNRKSNTSQAVNNTVESTDLAAKEEPSSESYVSNVVKRVSEPEQVVEKQSEDPKETKPTTEPFLKPKVDADVQRDAGNYERPDEWVGGHAPPQEKAISMKKRNTGHRQRGAEVTERPEFFLGGSAPVRPTGPRIKLKSNWMKSLTMSENLRLVKRC